MNRDRMAESGAEPSGRSRPFLLGLTGGMGMGKSTVAAMFRDEGVPVYDADAAVHELYAPGGAAVGPVGAAFPGVVVDGAVSRAELSKRVVGDEGAMRALEAIVHPLVEAHRAQFVDRTAASGAPIVVFDIPLLFEKGYQSSVDEVVVVSAPPDVQRTRVLARPGMTPAKLEALLARQVDDATKRAGAAHVLDTGVDPEITRSHVRRVLATLKTRPCPTAAAQARWGGAGGRYLTAVNVRRPVQARHTLRAQAQATPVHL